MNLANDILDSRPRKARLYDNISNVKGTVHPVRYTARIDNNTFKFNA